MPKVKYDSTEYARSLEGQIVQLAAECERQKKAIAEIVEAYGEMEKGIDDPILCHYNGLRLHNAMEDLRALVVPGYTQQYEPGEEERSVTLNIKRGDRIKPKPAEE